MVNDHRTERFLGLVAPIAICVFALYAASDGQVALRGRHGVLVLTGTDVLLFVVAAVSAALVLHAAWFWANTNWDAIYSQVGQIVGLLIFVAMIGLLVVRRLSQFP